MTNPGSSFAQPTRVLFVCLGNICRSPLAEGLFIHLARERGVLDRFTIDSCGTAGYHIGKTADPRSIAVGAKHGVDVPSRARQFDPSQDPDGFDLLLAMDADNRRDLISMGAAADQVRLMRSFDPAFAADPGRAPDVPDPYYGGPEGFDEVYDMLTRACGGLLDELLDELLGRQ